MIVYLLSTSPGFYFQGGETIRIESGASIAVEEHEVASLISQHSGFVVTGNDAPVVPEALPEAQFAVSTVTVQGELPALDPEEPELIPPIPALAFVNLAPGTPVAEALTYLQQLANTKPCPLHIVTEVATLYPNNKKVAAAIAKIVTEHQPVPSLAEVQSLSTSTVTSDFSTSAANI
jgi:hypothetical protein